MAHTITNGYSLFKKRTVLCESLRVTTEKNGLDWFSRGPQVEQAKMRAYCSS